MKIQYGIQWSQKIVALGMAGLLSASSCSAQTAPLAAQTNAPRQTTGMANGQRPNVLLILADDLGWSDLGCMGGEINTPNIDALATEGLKFTQCYNSARCCPSRASLLTGLVPNEAGIRDMSGELSERAVTLAEVLSGAGYSTSMVGKWHIGDRQTPVKRGFGEFYGMIGGFNSYWQEHPYYTRLPADHPKRDYKAGEFYSTDAFADYSIDFLTQAHLTPDKPWFQYLAFNAPHFPLHAPEEDIEKYEAVYTQGWDKIRAARLERQKQLGLIGQDVALTPRSNVPKNFINVHTGWADKDNPAWDSLPADRRADLARRMATYAAMVDKMDQAVGRVVAHLKQTNQYDNTVIFFLSDNGACAEWDPFGFDKLDSPLNIVHKGEDLKQIGAPASYVSYGSGWANASNTPWRLYKHYAQEGGIRSPLIVHWPQGLKTRPGSVRTEPTSVTDFMPTLVQMCGATYPAEHKGQSIIPTSGISLMPIFNGGQIASRTLCMEHEGNRMVREGDWKLVAIHDRPWELYDLGSDPTEMRDLSAQNADRVQKMSAEWQTWAEEHKVVPKSATNANTTAIATPQLVGKALTITCKVTPQGPSGVILAQGGDQRGYALYLDEGKPVFVVRQQGKLYTAAATEPPTGSFSLEAHLEKEGRMTLAVNGTIVARGKAPGVFAAQPMDELSIGEDSLSAVGNYKPPYALNGKVENVKVVAQ